MPSTIYNEGRVVGFSAYEIYVRHALCEDPTTAPASELEWLSSSIATGSSMLLKISAETAQEVSGHHIINIPLPADSNLSAANTIIGSLFIGEAEVDADGWATKVTSYGPLIENNATNPTAGDHSADTTIPPTTYTSPLSDEYQDMLLNYVKVVDGIVVQPGHWSANDQADQPPHKDFSPDLSKRPFVKIYVSDTITEDFYVLLTGFTLRTVLAGVSGLNGSTDTDTNFHNNGGFLGPAVFPWANKIVFSVPPAYVNYFIDKRYERAIQNKQSSISPESFQDSKMVKAVPVIDMESTDPATYYTDAADEAFKSYQMLSDRPGDWPTNYTKYFKRIGSTYQPVTGTTAPDASGEWPQDKYFKAITPSIKLDVTDANTTTGNRVLTIYQRSDLLPPALYATKVTQEGETKLYPVDTVAPGTIKLFENDSEGEAAKNLENEIPGNRAFIRNTNDYVVRQLNEGQNVVPVADVSSIHLDDPLRFEDLTPPFFSTSGGTSRDGSTTPSGTPADLENDRSFAVTLKRITGKLSSKIQELCGYEYDSNVFTTGIWSRSVKRLKDQISSADQDKYYYIVNAKSVGGTPYIFPVRKSDHVLDITIPYETRVYVNGSRWYPIFSNHSYDSSSTYPDSVYLGSYWKGANLNSEETLAGVPAAGSTIIRAASTQRWAYIIGAEHPTRKTRLADVSGQIDIPTAILPADKNGLPFEDYYQQDKLSDLYTESYLTTVGINNKYWSYSLDAFLKEALYTDMGTGLPLAENNPNRTQTLYLCSNGTQEEDIHLVLSFSLSNNETTAGKTQYVSLPEDMIDDSTSPIGTLTQTGNKQTITLSMADRNAKLYNFKGDSGNNIIPGDGNIHWNDLLDALANNKSIDLFSSARFLRELGLRLSAGLGIAINWDSKQRKYVITNTMPYNPAGQGYSRIYQSNAEEQALSVSYAHGGFDCISYNGWRSVDGRAFQWWGDGETFYEGSQDDPYGYPYNASDSGHGNSYYNQHLNLHSMNLHSDPNDTNGGAVRPVPRIGISVLPATYMDYKKIVCPAEPEDWEECWKYYYYELIGEEYVDLATKYRELLESAPDDWNTNYFNYYTYDSELNKCALIPASDRGAPTFQSNTYYKSVRPAWHGDTFTALSEQPGDWNDYDWYNNSKYYVKIPNTSASYAIYPRALLTYDSQTQKYQPPNFSDTTFYTRNDDAIFYVGYPNNVSVRLSGDTSYKSSTSGKTYSYQLALPPRLPYVSTTGAWGDGDTSSCEPVGSICKGFYISVDNTVDTSDGFLFAHNEGITSNTGKHSVMFGVKFTGKYAFLNHTQDMTSFTGKLTGDTLSSLVPNNDLVYNLTTTTLGTSGIWNVKKIHPNHYLNTVDVQVGTPPNTTTVTKHLRFFDLQSFDTKHRLDQYVAEADTSLNTWTTVDAGAAWGATCNIYPGPAYGYKTSTFIVSAAAYADGHNSQMIVWTGDKPDISDYSWSNMRGMDMTSLLTNLNITGLFYLS